MIICREQQKSFNGTKAVCVLISDEAPNTISGADIKGLDDSLSVDSGSICICPNLNKKYILGLDNNWYAMS